MAKPTSAQFEAVEALANALNVPDNGRWHQVTAYIKRDVGGTNPGITAVMAIPVSGREIRLIDEVVANEGKWHQPPDSDPF